MLVDGLAGVEPDGLDAPDGALGGGARKDLSDLLLKRGAVGAERGGNREEPECDQAKGAHPEDASMLNPIG